jgi:hypothetical protein
VSTLTLDLEDVERQPLPTAPYQRHSDTSKAAAQELQKTLGPKQRTVLRLLFWGPATDNELTGETVELYRWSVNTARPRRIELKKLGFVADTGEKRDGSTVWALTEAGRAYLEQEPRDA